MSLITRMRKQKAIYWKQRMPDESGQMGFYHGVEIRCRWEEKVRKAVNKNGEEFYSQALVYVDRDVKPGDMLYYAGVISDANPVAEEIPYSEGEPFEDPRSLYPTGVVEIQNFSSVPNIRATEFLRTAIV